MEGQCAGRNYMWDLSGTNDDVLTLQTNFEDWNRKLGLRDAISQPPLNGGLPKIGNPWTITSIPPSSTGRVATFYFCRT